ncbi:hypothetical protein LR090_01755 [Candidatus Bipolaricaulota bacterium]|nr:hypothetical protein [Candidatus Bipolaricaulota bacterium]
MDRPKTRDQVRGLVSRELRRDVNEVCWDHMIQRGLVDDVINDPDWQEPFRYLVEQYRGCEELVRRVLREASAQERTKKEVRAKPLNDRRWEALSLLLKRKAESQKGIRSFWKAIGAPILSPVEWLEKASSGLDKLMEKLVKT